MSMNEKIRMAHGSGGDQTSALIRGLFMKYFRNEWNAAMNDAAVLPLSGQIAFTTDSFVVDPIIFPGGDIGRLAVCGTVNDLLTSGSLPRYLSASFILEEGLPMDVLESICVSMQATAKEAGIEIVTGDTKVVSGRGGLFINTAGIGEIDGEPFDFGQVQVGDAILLNGTLGDHHACILSQRMEIENDICSDVAPLVSMMKALKAGNVRIRGMRDITRGGLATVLSEISEQTHGALQIREKTLPVKDSVASFCKVLGLEPLYMGNEGKAVFIVDGADAEKAKKIMQSCTYGENAEIIGECVPGKHPVLITSVGGKRRLVPLQGEGLPRIC
ncbi:MAG: hydrogenase expression/formation protein HypE [Clostridiales Family XIII bacterium]|jgi:hydrogenase expression/formation protein HypE|nr:hydrogenase expression/formation protein HypE [Clostridiales Family XIII bacterium]